MLDQMISNVQADNGQVRFVVYAVVNETDAREIARKLRYSGIAPLEELGKQFDMATSILEDERLVAARAMAAGIVPPPIEEPPPTKRNPSEPPKVCENGTSKP